MLLIFCAPAQNPRHLKDEVAGLGRVRRGNAALRVSIQMTVGILALETGLLLKPLFLALIPGPGSLPHRDSIPLSPDSHPTQATIQRKSVPLLLEHQSHILLEGNSDLQENMLQS